MTEYARLEVDGHVYELPILEVPRASVLLTSANCAQRAV